MSSMFLITLFGVVIAVAIHLTSRRQVHRCPVCESRNIRELHRTTEKIELDKRELPGIGSKVHVSATVSMRCYTCGHGWEWKERT